VIAALLPTLDPITLVLEMVPLIALYELSVQLAQLFAPPARRRDGVPAAH
jgi:Sec-independent protein secretion pathway component TatC